MDWFLEQNDEEKEDDDEEEEMIFEETEAILEIYFGELEDKIAIRVVPGNNDQDENSRNLYFKSKITEVQGS